MRKDKKKWTALGLIGILLFAVLLQIGVQAAVDNTAVLEVASDSWKKWPSAPEIGSGSAVVMDAFSGAVVYDKGAQAERYPAGAVRLMTLLIAAENGSLDQPVIFTENSRNAATAGSGNIQMKVGEEMPLRDWLYLMMLDSSKEAALQIAESVGGTEATFVDGMNQKAAQLGCMHTHFAHSTGAQEEETYSCAYDLALIMRANLQNAACREVLSAQTYTLQATNMTSEARTLSCTAPLQAQGDAAYYEGCIAQITDETPEAGWVMVTAAERAGSTFITVSLYSTEGTAAEHTGLLDYAFSEFVRVEEEGGSFLVPVKTRKRAIADTEAVLKKKNELGIVLPAEYAATQTADIKVFYYDGGIYVGLGDAPIADPTPTVTPQPTATMTPTPTPLPKGVLEQLRTEGLSRTAQILLYIMGGMVALIVVLLILLAVKKHRRRKR